MKRKWVCIEIRSSADRLDELATEIATAFGLSVEIPSEGIRFYLKEDFFFNEGQRKLEAILSSFLSLSPAETSFTYVFTTIAEDDWLEQWKLHFKPLRVGKHLVIAPTWENVDQSPGDRVIYIDPGRAFGTGHHETTMLCLEWLEEWADGDHKRRSKSLLDVGTGSGILAIAGALLGCSPILAVDNDPEAIDVARENLILNGVASIVELQLGTVAEVHDRYEVVLANIQALPLIEMAELLVQRLEYGAILVLSGILLEQKAQVQAAYEARGLKLRKINVAGEWCLLELKRFKEGRE